MSAGRRVAAKPRAEVADTDLPAPLAEVLELLAGESAASRTFIGGLVLGALVGAALAGGTLVRRGTGRETGKVVGRALRRGIGGGRMKARR